MFAILGIAAVTDLTERRVSNRLFLLGLIACFSLAVGNTRERSLLIVLIDLVLPVIFLILLSLAQIIGAGDVKLFSIVSGIAGFPFATKVFVMSVVIGAVWSFILLIYKKALWKNLRCAFMYMTALMHGHVYAYDAMEGQREALTIPFAACIAVSCGIAKVIQFLE